MSSNKTKTGQGLGSLGSLTGNTGLVWSNDPKDQAKIAAAAQKKPGNVPEKMIQPGSFTAVFRIEKGGRGGKTVTVIDQLPRHETFLKELCKELKNKCGTGGTFEVESDRGFIEIQGDKRDQIKQIFEKKGFRFKGM
ncbi:MAG: translation initiation factor [Bdellovibrionaceae bacterium]|nr:translation initiation factor [Pseudobdellovibrionaceae bacterium]